ncbi:hypothetical protein WP50_20290, partial [Lactiplantibacillus plantarum]
MIILVVILAIIVAVYGTLWAAQRPMHQAQKTAYHRLSTPFDLEHQARLFVATDATAAEAPSGKQRVAYLTHAIHDIVMAAPKQTLVLFNSLNMIEAVFYSLHQTDLPGDREILAQG